MGKDTATIERPRSESERKRKAKRQRGKKEEAGKLGLLSWNVNGLRSVVKKGFEDWFRGVSPDILCLQETKAHPEQLSPALREPEGYQAFFSAAERKGYSGTALYTRLEPRDVQTALGADAFDHEGRTVIAEFDDFTLINVYVPNGRSDRSRVSFKLAFSDVLLEFAESRRKRGKGVILCGDFNTAHREIDLARPKQNRKSTGFLPEECAWLDTFMGKGYVDTFRRLHPDKTGAYTWWDFRTRARPRNVGWRLDYFFVSEDLLPRLKTASIHDDVMGSDHCPVGIELALGKAKVGTNGPRG